MTTLNNLTENVNTMSKSEFITLRDLMESNYDEATMRASMILLGRYSISRFNTTLSNLK